MYVTYIASSSLLVAVICVVFGLKSANANRRCVHRFGSIF